MKNMIYFAFLFFVSFYSSTAQNEPVLEGCTGGRLPSDCLRCEIYCSQRHNPPPCPLQCRVACACPNNTYVNSKGACVEAKDCDVTVSDPCTGGKVYSNCIRCQERTCENFLTNPPCSTGNLCASGCRCPNQLVLNGDRCVYASECFGVGVEPEISNLCNPACVNGVCVIRTRGQAPTCICDLGYEGSSCSSIVNGGKCRSDCLPPDYLCVTSGFYGLYKCVKL